MRSAGFRTGLFVLAGIALALVVVFFLSGVSLNAGQHYESYFAESVEGLGVGSAVKFRGVTVGKVTEISLVTAAYPPKNLSVLSKAVYHQVVVRFRVSPGKLGPGINADTAKQAIKGGLRVKVAPQGITGIAYLALGFIPSAAPPQKVPWHPQDMVIPSAPSTLTEVTDAVQHLFTAIDKVDLNHMIDNLSSLVTTLNSEASRGDAHQLLHNANIVLDEVNTQLKGADLPATTAALRNLTNGSQTQAILTQLNKASQGLARSSARMPQLLATTQQTVAATNGTVATLERQLLPALRNLDAASANLRELSENLKQDPAILLRGSPPPPP